MGALMMGLLREYWAQLALVLAGLLLGWLLQGWRLGMDVAEARQSLAEYQAGAATRAAEAEAAARAEEQRRQREIEEVLDEARGLVERASADARIADDRAGGLQREVARLRAGRAATCSAISAQRGEAAGDALGMLADVLIEMERAGRELAAEADRRGVAGRACERSYEALRQR